jgi:hypothetical protein
MFSVSSVGDDMVMELTVTPEPKLTFAALQLPEQFIVLTHCVFIP